MTERFFVKTTPAVRKAIQYMAVDLNSSLEKLGGALLELAVERAAADIKSGKIIVPPRREK